MQLKNCITKSRSVSVSSRRPYEICIKFHSVAVQVHVFHLENSCPKNITIYIHIVSIIKRFLTLKKTFKKIYRCRPIAPRFVFQKSTFLLNIPLFSIVPLFVGWGHYDGLRASMKFEICTCCKLIKNYMARYFTRILKYSYSIKYVVM